MTMQSLESSYTVYGRTYQEAVGVIRRRGLWTCVAHPEPWLGVWFSDERDLTLFALQFQGVLDFSDALAIVPPWHVAEVEDFLADWEWGERIERYAFLAVEFFDPEHQRIFNEDFGLGGTDSPAKPETTPWYSLERREPAAFDPEWSQQGALTNALSSSHYPPDYSACDDPLLP